jgi:hypothetical protein
MPWCDECSKFWNPPELSGGGECPSCGRLISGRPQRPVVAPALPGGQAGVDEPDLSGAVAKTKGAPWHFKLLVVGVTVYMIYRIYWLAEWLPKHV